MSRIDNPRLDRYFSEVGKYPLPTEAEEKELFAKYKALREKLEATGDTSIEPELNRVTHRIATGYLRFVIRHARKRTKDNNIFSDLISEGNVGLMIAIQRFDLSFGTRFLTYAASWITVKMQEALHRLKDVNIQSHARKEAKKNKEELPEITFTPIESVMIADADAEIRVQELNGLELINKVGLTTLEKLLVVYAFGFRGSPKKPDAVRQIVYDLDGTALCSKQHAEHLNRALNKIKGHLKARKVRSANDYFEP